ncbi:DNA ligase 3 [Nephila pilipes]|uniref:DNA ligase 3 n=1 Tax=Nephila pilipes TaxID=299642 RepID=A0A8X6N155_NEPPI|nr:DNA ligase 3 [Nephila pilipes]
MANNRYCIDLAKRGTAGCKECKQKIEKGLVRIAKIIPNPFTDSGGEMKQWFHVKCIFVKLSRARATTKKIESTDDLEGWDELEEEHKPDVLKCLSEYATNEPPKKTPPKKTGKAKKETTRNDEENDEPAASDDDEVAEVEDNCFQRFRKICTKLGKHPKYTDKTAILQAFFTKGSDGESFKGNLYLWIKMLLPAVEKRIYNLQNTQIIKIFSKIFEVSQEEMLEDFQSGIGKGDVSETVKVFFEQSNSFQPAEESKLYLQDVDKYLDQLSKTGQEVEQTNILTKVAKRCTSSDLKYFIRFIKHDLRINAGPKHILVPDWLNINKGVIPDFVVEDPKKSPVWEISGAEFSRAEIHTASGISIRFPRVSKVRTDKNWKTATNLQELKDIYEASKTKSELIGLRTGHSDVDDDDDNDDADKSSASSSGETPKKKYTERDESVSKKQKIDDTVNGSPDEEKANSKKSDKANTRKRNSAEDSTPSKKRKLDSSTLKKTESSSKTSGANDLPSIFSGVKLHIPSSLEKSDELRRYFVAYDGQLLKDHETSEASHVIVSDDQINGTIPKGAKKVTADWLWDSIKLKKKLSASSYKPQKDKA